jgi:PhoH-like ATPase
MSRINVIDSSVLLSEGKNAIYGFGSDEIVIPLVVISEVANKRNDPDLGYQAREVLREITKLKSIGDINTGVKLENGGTLRIEVNHIDSSNLPPSIAAINNNDIRILAVAHSLTEEQKETLISATEESELYREATETDVILVTQDITLQILAAVVKVKAEAFVGTKPVDKDTFIKSIIEVAVDDSAITEIYETGKTQIADIDVPINTAVLLKTHDGSNSALAICKASWAFELIKTSKIGKIESKSKEQAVAINYLMDNSIGVVSLGGRAGSGKSMLSLAAALALVEDKRTPYEKIVIFRPMNAVGGPDQELGFLPGTLDEKLAPIMEPVYDCISTFKTKIDVEKIKREKLIEFRSIAHARGSSLGNCIILVDEVQNLSKSTIGTLLTRAGINSRIFLCWDVQQTDAKYIGKYEGIFKVVRFLLGKKLFAHVSLIKSERSPIAEMASEILEDLV